MSALDAIADGPQAKALGITARLHNVAERYASLIAHQRFGFVAHELEIMAGVPHLELIPVGCAHDIRLSLASRLGELSLDRDTLRRWIGALSKLNHLQLVALIEHLEEIATRGAV